MTTDPRHSAFRRAIEEAARYTESDFATDRNRMKHKPTLNLNDGRDHYRWIAANIRAIPNPFPEEAEPQESALRSALDRTGIALIASTNSGDGHAWVVDLIDPENLRITWCAWCGRHMSEVEDWAECPPCDAFVAVRRALSPAQDETEEKPQPSPGINPSTTEKQTP